jgi:hypothetical protein
MQVGPCADMIDREIIMFELAHPRRAFVEDALAPDGGYRSQCVPMSDYAVRSHR